MRTSERRDLKRCPQRWEWAWVYGLKPLRDKNPLWFGSGVHIALAEWYQEGKKRGPHPAKTWLAYCEDEERFIPTDYEDDELKYADARDLGEEMLVNYVDEYGKDEHWNVISTEQTFRTLVPDPRLPSGIKLSTKTALLRYLGTFDGVYRDSETGELWLMEHKTAAAIMTHHLPLDDQAGSYCWVATKVLRKQGLIKKNEEIQGVMYNFLRKASKDTRPVNAAGLRCNKPKKEHYINQLGELVNPKMKLDEMEAVAQKNGVVVLGDPSERQPSALFERIPALRSAGDRRMMLKRIQDEAIYKEKLLDGTVPVFKNPNRDCSWDCSFYRMCILHESGEDWEEYRDAMYKKVDPYADHRDTRKSS